MANSDSRKSVLIVDDDEDFVRVLAEILESHGYEVHCAFSGESAVEVVSKLKRPIDLLLTDLVMFPLSGTDLAEQFMIRYPNLKVIFMSGYTEEFIRNTTGRTDVAFLAKPVNEDLLIAKIKQACD